MANIRLSIGQVNITDYLIAIARKTTTPSVEEARVVLTPPHPTIMNIILPASGELDPVVYYVDFRESPNGSDIGLLLSQFVYDAKNKVIISERRFYRVDGEGEHDPVDGSSVIIDPYFNGKNVSGVFKEGFRFLITGDEWDHTEDTITLTNVAPLSSGEVIAVEISYSAEQTGSGGNTPSFPIDVIEITNDVIIDSTHFNKLMEINGSSSILNVNFPPFASIPDNTKFAFNTDGGTQRYVAFILSGGNAIRINGETQVFWLGKGEHLIVQKKGSYLRILQAPENWQRVGQLVKQDIAPLNSIPELGGWYLISQYPRLFNWYINKLPPAQLGSANYPNTPSGDNIRKWCIHLNSGYFWVPDTRGYFDRNTDPSGTIDSTRPVNQRISGTSQAHQVGEFIHKGYLLRKAGTNNSVVVLQNVSDANTSNPDVTLNTGKETRPFNINRNAYRII